MSVRIAVVTRDESVRLQAARAFDAASADWIVELHPDVPAEVDVVVAGPDVDLADAVPFDPARPRAVLEGIRGALAERAARGRLIAVTAASGGVGTTTVALHLAAAFARRAMRVALVDLDPASGVTTRLRLPDSSLTWDAVEDDEESLRRGALPVAGGFRVLLSPGAGADGAQRLLELARGAFDPVVVDLGGAAEPDGIVRACSAAVVVVAPTPSGAKRARRMLDGWRGAPPVALVGNRVGPGGETTTRDVERVLERRLALELPCTPSLRDAEDDGRLLTSRWSRWSRRIDRLAAALEGRCLRT